MYAYLSKESLMQGLLLNELPFKNFEKTYRSSPEFIEVALNLDVKNIKYVPEPELQAYLNSKKYSFKEFKTKFSVLSLELYLSVLKSTKNYESNILNPNKCFEYISSILKLLQYDDEIGVLIDFLDQEHPLFKDINFFYKFVEFGEKKKFISNEKDFFIPFIYEVFKYSNHKFQMNALENKSFLAALIHKSYDDLTEFFLLLPKEIQNDKEKMLAIIDTLSQEYFRKKGFTFTLEYGYEYFVEKINKDKSVVLALFNLMVSFQDEISCEDFNGILETKTVKFNEIELLVKKYVEKGIPIVLNLFELDGSLSYHLKKDVSLVKTLLNNVVDAFETFILYPFNDKDHHYYLKDKDVKIILDLIDLNSMPKEVLLSVFTSLKKEHNFNQEIKKLKKNDVTIEIVSSMLTEFKAQRV